MLWSLNGRGRPHRCYLVAAAKSDGGHYPWCCTSCNQLAAQGKPSAWG